MRQIGAAEFNGRQLFEALRPHEPFPIATGKLRNGYRLLTVGIDCSLDEPNWAAIKTTYSLRDPSAI
jgi:hypothetical protein